MKKITFECETITPMFLAGADGKTPELRSPSIKGAMRFWWRAMNGYLSIEELKKKEDEIFGASDEKIGRSNVNLRLSEKDIQIGKYRPLPHSNSKQFKVSCLLPFSKFLILISSQKPLEFYKDLLSHTILLGGFGKRARRGFGSVRILSVDKKSNNIECNLKNILNSVNILSNDKYKIENRKIVLKKDLTVKYPFLREIQLGEKYDSWEDLLCKISEESHKHNINSLGFAKGKNRLASPIYVSILKDSINNKYLPIISTLNTVFEDNSEIDEEGQNAFKEAIL